MNKRDGFDLKELKIEVTHDCSLTCIHCSSDSMLNTNRVMTKEKCMDIIKEAADLGATEIAFSGGEPMLCEWLSEAVNLSSILGYKIKIYTSGNVENVESLLRDYKLKGLHTAVFSIYSENQQEHERVTRKRGSFAKTWEAIDIANKLNIQTEVHFVALSTNFTRIPAIAQMAKQHDVHSISILRFVPQGRGSLASNLILNKKENLELASIIKDLKKQGYEIRTGSPFNFLLVNENPACNSAIDRLIVSPDSRIYPCDAFKQIKAEEIVNTVELNEVINYSLSECWARSPYFNAVRKYLRSDFCIKCSNCRNVTRCLSGCLAQKFIKYGELRKAPDPNCLVSDSGEV